MRLEHGMKVRCELLGSVINDAKISIDPNGKIFICQNIYRGISTENKLGYNYSWSIERDAFVNCHNIKKVNTDWDE